MVGKRRAYKPRRKMGDKKKGLNKIQRSQVKALVVKPAETKYVSEFARYANNFGVFILGQPISQTVISGGGLNSAWSLIPYLLQAGGAVNGATRIGNKVSNVTLKADFQFWINPARTQASTVDYTLKLFILKAKSIKSNALIQSLPVGALLDNGDATSIDWTSFSGAADKALATYPVNKEVFTVCSVKSFRLFVNQGVQSGDVTAGTAPNSTNHESVNFSYTHKHKGNLVYLDNNLIAGTPVVPENLNLFCYAVVYDTNAYAVAAPGIVLGTCRTHMWYKDM